MNGADGTSSLRNKTGTKPTAHQADVFIRPSATVFGEKGVSTAGIYGHGVPVNRIVPTDDKYLGDEGLAIEMAKLFQDGPTPVPPPNPLELFAFMHAAHESKRQNGAVVKVSDLLKKVAK